MTVNEYLKLPYHYVFVKVGKNWHCKIEEFDCFIVKGETLQKTYTSARENMKQWIEDLSERGLEIPLPKED